MSEGEKLTLEALAKRLEEEFTIQDCQIGRRGVTKFVLGHDWMLRTVQEYDQDMRNAPTAD